MNIALRFSQLNGLIGDLFNGIGRFFTNILSVVFAGLIVAFYNFVIVPIALTMDAIQMLFRKFAGLDNYLYEGELQSGDVVLSLINSETVQNVFWSLVILAVVLLIITTVVALIRAQTQSMDDKSRRTNNQIFVTALKALVNFFMVPVVAILGIFMGNALLKSLDQATSGGNNVRVSSVLFVSCAYDCNRARTSTTFATDLSEGLNNMGVLKGTPEDIADAVDEAFKNGTSFEAQSFDIGASFSNLFSEKAMDYIYLFAMAYYSGGTAAIPRMCFSIFDAWQVFYYYDLLSFNFLVFIAASLFVLWVLITTSIGLIKRMFKLVILLVISPPIAALMPLDNGGALAKWRKEFIGSVLAAYATVVAFNLTLMLLGPILEINFFYIPGTTSTGIATTAVNMIIQILIVCGAMLFFKDFTKSISQMIGAEDAHDAGVGATKAIASKVAMVATAGAAAAGAKAAKVTAGKLKAKTAGLQKKKDDASGDVAKAQKEFDEAKTPEEKLKAQQNLDRAKENQKDANDAFAKNEKGIEDYEALAHKKMNVVKNNTLSVATNGLSDGFTKGADGLRDMTAKMDKGSRKLAQKPPRMSFRARRKMKNDKAAAEYHRRQDNLAKVRENRKDAIQRRDAVAEELKKKDLYSWERNKLEDELGSLNEGLEQDRWLDLEPEDRKKVLSLKRKQSRNKKTFTNETRLKYRAEYYKDKAAIKAIDADEKERKREEEVAKKEAEKAKEKAKKDKGKM